MSAHKCTVAKGQAHEMQWTVMEGVGNHAVQIHVTQSLLESLMAVLANWQIYSPTLPP